MAAHLNILLLFSGLKGVHSITTVNKVSVTAGKSVSIPCLYDSRYMNHVKYLCEGYYWTSCRCAVKTNKPDRSGKYSILDDKNQKIFTVTINQLTKENTDYWCVVEIDRGPDHGKYFQLSVTSGTPSLYVDHQQITGYIGENITIRCHHSNSGGMKWCRLGRKCVTGSSGSIDGTTVTTHMTEKNVFTVTMSGLKPEDSGWYWCDEGDIQIPVHLTVTEKLITTTTGTTTRSVTGNGPITTLENEQHRGSSDLKILIIPLSVLILIVIVVLFIWLILRNKQSKAESSATAMAGEEVTYSEVRVKKRSSAKVNEDAISTSVGKMIQKAPEEEGAEVTYSTVAIHHQNI
ncbi:polymeric immunoglobulin receptor-like [Archocentrus centrarchus]|uniref:polymeric immunoglobulin receptor-like n=1 Tax=Archocentrus centrarchus TaxID=63155 RepID=UPI0011E9D4DA|nr:polymeric immunoglobulin receptor-like [Archocentrus centrarchus]